MQTVTFKNRKMHYQDDGQGEAIVLLHGYLESSAIWNSFAVELSKQFRVIRPDIPGHGKSGVTGDVHSMEMMADAIKTLLDLLVVDKCTLIGHSMGGYVALAFLRKYPEKLKALSLFHSTPFADTEEKKSMRDREAELVRAGKKAQIINTNIPKAFADENLIRLKNEVNKAKELGIATADEGIIAILNGMKERTDNTKLLQNTKLPFLLVLGKKDNYINFNQIITKIKLPANSSIIALENIGHMGFVEESGRSLEVLTEFIKHY